MSLQPGAFAASPGDLEAEAPDSGLAQRRRHRRQQPQIFLRREAADIAQHEVRIRARAAPGVKELGIDAPPHGNHPAAGARPQDGGELGIGREQHLPAPEEPADAIHHEPLDEGRRAIAKAAGQPGANTADAARRELVKVGVPGGRERNIQPRRDDSSEDTQAARAGEVDEVGPKAPHPRLGGFEEAEEQQVEAQIGIEREGDAAARQIQTPHRTVFARRGALAGANAEERQATPSRECIPFAAGAGGAVHLVKRVGEESDAGSAGHGISGSSLTARPRAIESTARIPGLARNPITETKLWITGWPPSGHSYAKVTISPLSVFKKTRSSQRARPVNSG